MKMRNLTMAGLLATTLIATTAGPAFGVRDQTGPKKGVTWYSDGGTPNTDSVDGPKNSNSFTLTPTSFIYPRGYWDMTVANSTWKFSYIADDVTGAGQVRWSVLVYDGHESVEDAVIYLDPFHCPGAEDSNGWATTNFKRIGSDCAIYVSGTWQSEPFVGTDPVVVGGVTTPGTSAWDALLAGLADDSDDIGELVYNGFLIVDEAGPAEGVTVDRVTVGGNVISKFPVLPYGV